MNTKKKAGSFGDVKKDNKSPTGRKSPGNNKSKKAVPDALPDISKDSTLKRKDEIDNEKKIISL